MDKFIIPDEDEENSSTKDGTEKNGPKPKTDKQGVMVVENKTGFLGAGANAFIDVAGQAQAKFGMGNVINKLKMGSKGLKKKMSTVSSSAEDAEPGMKKSTSRALLKEAKDAELEAAKAK